MYKRTSQHKIEFLQAGECYNFCSITQRSSHGCKDTALPDPLLKNHSVKCLTFEKETWKPYNDKFCLLRALALHLHGNGRLEEETSKIINRFLEKTGRTDSANFRSVFKKDIAAVEAIAQADIFLYSIDPVDGSLKEELARRSVGKYSNTVRILRHNSHIYHVSNFNALFNSYRSPSCDHFIEGDYDLEQHLTSFKEGDKHVFSKKKRVSTPRHTIWQIRVVQYPFLRWSKRINVLNLVSVEAEAQLWGLLETKMWSKIFGNDHWKFSLSRVNGSYPNETRHFQRRPKMDYRIMAHRFHKASQPSLEDASKEWIVNNVFRCQS